MKKMNLILSISAVSILLSACGGSGDHMPVAAGGNKTLSGNTGGSNKPSNGAQVTYKDVKPIFEKNCTSCHAPGGALPNWLDYQVAFAKRDRLLNRVVEKKDMPMGTKLADTDMKTIATWLNEGAPADVEETPAQPVPPVAQPAPPVAQPTPPVAQPPAEQPAPPVTPPVASPQIVTFKDVKAVFERNCTMCHAPGGGLPNWLDYQTSFEKRDRIYDRVIVKKDMPMGNKLSDEDFKLLESWLKDGALNDKTEMQPAPMQPAAPVITYKEVKPIFEKNCSMCHVAGGALPNWLDYKTAFEKRDRIFDRAIVKKDMPMGMTLSQEDFKTLETWLIGGALPEAAAERTPQMSHKILENILDPVQNISSPVTFKDVKPILEKRCVGCHSGLDMGNGSQDWGVYSSAFDQRQKIYERVVVLKNMPLYSSMPKEERELVRDWVEQGGQE